MRTIAFTGGRTYSDSATVARILAGLGDIRILVGDASGLDALVRDYAKVLDLSCSVFVAHWDKHGKAAGPLRNRTMLDEGPDLLIAFPGGIGTANCIKQAREMGIPVLEVKP